MEWDILNKWFQAYNWTLWKENVYILPYKIDFKISTRRQLINLRIQFGPRCQKRKLVKFKNPYELMEMRSTKGKARKTIHQILVVKMIVKRQEWKRGKKKKTNEPKLFIRGRLLKSFRYSMQLSTFNHLLILYSMIVSLTITSSSVKRALVKHE